MPQQLRELAVLLLIVCALSLPGLLRRWVTYRTLADLLSVGSAVLLGLASAWEVWGNSCLTFGFPELIVSGVLWTIAALVVFLAFVQNQIVEAEYVRRRLASKRWWERMLFYAGFVEFGRNPRELKRDMRGIEEVGSRTEFSAERSGSGTVFYLVVGTALFGIGLILAIGLQPGTAGGRVGTLLCALGVMAIGGGTVDALVLLQNRKDDSSSEVIRCPFCDYDLRGLPQRRCPECGEPF